MSQGTATVIGIGLTFVVAAANFFYSFTNNKKTRFVNTVTTSRIKWIDSLRDKVAAYIAVTVHLQNLVMHMSDRADNVHRERDTLVEQIIMHLNPRDEEDGAIQVHVERLVTLTDGVQYEEMGRSLILLREATRAYLKKEWDKVKLESEKGRLSKDNKKSQSLLTPEKAALK
jgi:hypothetical protein